MDAPQIVARRADLFETTVFYTYLAGLAWCPFWFGSNDLIAWGINAALFPSLVAIYEFSILIRGQAHPIGLKYFKIPSALFVGVVLWILIQSSTWTPSSLHHPIWKMAADVLEKPVQGSISGNRDLTILALVRLMTCASVFWLSLQLCRLPSRAHFLVKAIATIGCGYAAFGLLYFAIMPGHVLGLYAPQTIGRVSSTFLNQNSFGTYIGIALIAICGLLLGLYRNEVAKAGSIHFKTTSLIEATGKNGAAAFLSALLLLVSLLLSGSRGALLSSCLGLFVFGVLILRRRKRDLTEHRGTIIVVTLLVAALFVAFSDFLVIRIAQSGLSDDNRLAVYSITLRSILDAPLFGYGYGTFGDVFPMFRNQSLSVIGTWLQAHNTYLEIFQGLGLVFGTMLIAAVVVLVARCVKGARTRQQNAIVPAVAASVAFLVGVNSFVDFSLQIQAVAITFMAVLGAGVAQSESSRIALND